MVSDRKVPNIREDDPFLARNTSISHEKQSRFSRETNPFLARIASISREDCKMFSRELKVVLTRIASCPRRARKIGSSGIFLASEPSAPFQAIAPKLQTQRHFAQLWHSTPGNPKLEQRHCSPISEDKRPRSNRPIHTSDETGAG